MPLLQGSGNVPYAGRWAGRVGRMGGIGKQLVSSAPPPGPFLDTWGAPPALETSYRKLLRYITPPLLYIPPLLSSALRRAVQTVMNHANTTFVSGLTVSDRGPRLEEFLRNIMNQLEEREDVPWGDTSAAIAGAYENISLAARQTGNHDELRGISAQMRDVIVVAVIPLAGGHEDEGRFKSALARAFGRELDKKELCVLLMSYHNLFHGVEGAFRSGNSQVRNRPRRERQQAREELSPPQRTRRGASTGGRMASRARQPSSSQQPLRRSTQHPMPSASSTHHPMHEGGMQQPAGSSTQHPIPASGAAAHQQPAAPSTSSQQPASGSSQQPAAPGLEELGIQMQVSWARQQFDHDQHELETWGLEMEVARLSAELDEVKLARQDNIAGALRQRGEDVVGSVDPGAWGSVDPRLFPFAGPSKRWGLRHAAPMKERPAPRTLLHAR